MPGLIKTPMAIETYVEAGFDRADLLEARFITGVSLAVDGGQATRVG